MRAIFLFVVIVLLVGCSPPFIIQFPDDVEELVESKPEPELVNKDYWEENGYAVGMAEKTPAGEDVTVVEGVLLKSWTDNNGNVYVLVRAAGVIPWEKYR